MVAGGAPLGFVATDSEAMGLIGESACALRGAGNVVAQRTSATPPTTSASPATGSRASHLLEQKMLMDEAFA